MIEKHTTQKTYFNQHIQLGYLRSVTIKLGVENRNADCLVAKYMVISKCESKKALKV